MAEISKEDVFLMMKSYENNVKYNTQLYDRQDIMVKEQVKVIDSLREITIEQQQVNAQLKILIDTLTTHNALCNVTSTDITKSISDGQLSNVRDHGKLRYHLIGISSGLIVIIIGLVTALGKMLI